MLKGIIHAVTREAVTRPCVLNMTAVAAVSRAASAINYYCNVYVSSCNIILLYGPALRVPETTVQGRVRLLSRRPAACPLFGWPIRFTHGRRGYRQLYIR